MGSNATTGKSIHIKSILFFGKAVFRPVVTILRMVLCLDTLHFLLGIVVFNIQTGLLDTTKTLLQCLDLFEVQMTKLGKFGKDILLAVGDGSIKLHSEVVFIDILLQFLMELMGIFSIEEDNSVFLIKNGSSIVAAKELVNTLMYDTLRFHACTMDGIA